MDMIHLFENLVFRPVKLYKKEKNGRIVKALVVILHGTIVEDINTKVEEYLENYVILDIMVRVYYIVDMEVDIDD